MGKQSRRKFSSEFKAKVALEALQERSSLETLSKKYDLHPNQISLWKKELQANSMKIFEKSESKKIPVQDKLVEELYAQIGKLKVDNDWLKKKLQ